MSKPIYFPELPLVLIEWDDASMQFGDEVDPDDEGSMRRFGGTMLTEEPGYLVQISHDKVVCALSKWPVSKKGGRSNTIPKKMVVRIWDPITGKVYFQRKRAILKPVVEQANEPTTSKE